MEEKKIKEVKVIPIPSAGSNPKHSPIPFFCRYIVGGNAAKKGKKVKDKKLMEPVIEQDPDENICWENHLNQVTKGSENNSVGQQARPASCDHMPEDKLCIVISNEPERSASCGSDDESESELCYATSFSP